MSRHKRTFGTVTARRKGLGAAFRGVLLACFVLDLLPVKTFADEATLGEASASSSVRGLGGPFAKTLEAIVEAETLFPNLKRQLEKLSPFFRDTHATLNTRTYYFDREFRSLGKQSEAWAIGGSVDYETGWYRDWLSFGAGYYQSEKLLGEEDRGGTLLLAPGQEGIAVVGKAYAKLKCRDHQAVLYRQELNVPYVNKQDSRMIPNTFEAYKLKGAVHDVPVAGTFHYILGYVDEVKQRNADRFISMSEAAGVAGKDRGLVMAGAAVQPHDDLIFGAINHFVDDTLNIFYTEADYHCPLTEELGLRFQGQFTHQQSVGDDLLTDSDFETWVLGGRVAASYQGLILKAAFSTTDDEQKIRSPFGSYPGYISLMQKDFNRADEDAWLVGASYDFGQVGLEGLSFFTSYAEGLNARDGDDGSALSDQREFDITADYRIREGVLKNLWLRARWSTLDLAGEDRNTDDFRVIVNYEIPIL